MNANGGLPQTVNVRDEQGNIAVIPYRELKQHEEFIIEDNISWGYMHGDTDAELDEYEKKARQEWKDLKNKLRENPELLLTLDTITERFVPYIEDPNSSTADPQPVRNDGYEG